MEIESLLNSQSPSASDAPLTAQGSNTPAKGKMSNKATAQPAQDDQSRGYGHGSINYHPSYPYPQGGIPSQQATPGQQEPYGGTPLDETRSQDSPAPLQPNKSSSSNPPPRQYPCKTCGKGFARRSDLVRHERIHTGEKPHSCKFPGCSKQFIQRSALTVHERIHTGDKPHVCENCNKPFGDSSSLARHRRIHSGSRPYACTFPNCQKTFTRKTTLTRHMQHHNATAEQNATVEAAAVLASRAQASIKDDDDTFSEDTSSLPPGDQDHSYQQMGSYQHGPPQHHGYGSSSHYAQSPEMVYGQQRSPSASSFHPQQPVYMNQQRPSITSHPSSNAPMHDQHSHSEHSQARSASGSPHPGSYNVGHHYTQAQHQAHPPPPPHHPQHQHYTYNYADPQEHGGYGQPMYYSHHPQHHSAGHPQHPLPHHSGPPAQGPPPQSQHGHHYHPQSQPHPPPPHAGPPPHAQHPHQPPLRHHPSY